MPSLWDHYHDADAFIQAVCEEARAQREADSGKSSEGRPHVKQRPFSDMCLAFSVGDGYFYVGYSGTSGGIVYDGHRVLPPKGLHGQADRRLERLQDAIEIDWRSDPKGLGRDLANCAEACALAVALAWKQPVDDLVFVAFYGAANKQHANELKDPCENCQTWVAREAYGYYSASARTLYSRK